MIIVCWFMISQHTHVPKHQEHLSKAAFILYTIGGGGLRILRGGSQNLGIGKGGMLIFW